jgi:hypothetical protein
MLGLIAKAHTGNASARYVLELRAECDLSREMMDGMDHVFDCKSNHEVETVHPNVLCCCSIVLLLLQVCKTFAKFVQSLCKVYAIYQTLCKL